MKRFCALATLLAAACAERDFPASPQRSTASRPIAPAVAPYPPDLELGLEAARDFEAERRPCLANARGWPQLAPEDRRRQREVQSDSHWLNRHLRERYPERLAYSGLDRQGGRWRHLVRLTGHAPIPPLLLADRAADVPVVVEYGAPWSLAEVARRRQAASGQAVRLVPDLNGEGYHEWMGYGAIALDVYSPDGKPRADVLEQCDALRRLYRLPVLIEFSAGRVTLM